MQLTKHWPDTAVAPRLTIVHIGALQAPLEQHQRCKRSNGHELRHERKFTSLRALRHFPIQSHTLGFYTGRREFAKPVGSGAL